MKKYSVIIAGQHSTSISLEEDFYQVLLDIAKEKNTTPFALITEIDLARTTPNLSSAIRVYILKYLQDKLKQF
ncbi:MAG: aryl-sulfate sulfotransferase [Alphaproteobacteria bacterium]|nr:aryl-sulfate sulfotransferase [Alphaproteobacteria bacterium]